MGRIYLKKQVLTFILTGLLLCSIPNGDVHAGMTDYCIVPPYVVQNIQPNVLILLDVSRSMQYFAYYDGYNTPDNDSDDILCSTSPCEQFNWSGRPAAHRYYGFFDPDQWYTYSSNVFRPAGPRSTPNDNAWSGDFLNWLTMRRIDVMQKVLTGGKPTGNTLTGWKPDGSDLGIYRRVTSAELSANTPFSDNTGGNFTFNSGSGGNTEFTVYRRSNGNSLGTFRVTVQVPTPVEGVLQQVVGAKARVGLMLFRGDGVGGTVVADVGKAQGNLSSLASTIAQINNSVPTVTATPLAEALWSATGYFGQVTGTSSTGPSYSNQGSYTVNANNDPMNYGTGGAPRYPICQKNFVLLLTDGEPCADGSIPGSVTTYGTNSSFNCTGQECPARSGSGYSFPYRNLDTSYCGSGDTSGVEDVALFMHTTDLRNYPTYGVDNIAGFQNLTLYSVFAFGRGSTLLKYAAINGGFENSGAGQMPSTGLPSSWDKDGDGIPDTYYEATEGSELEAAVRNAFSSMLKRASSGTAASVLASGEGSGANLIQAIFYPRRAFGNDVIWWAGALQNLWYHVDPFFSNATIREDTASPNVLDLANDDIVQFNFNQATQLTEVLRWRDDGDGIPDSADTPVTFENINSLWEAGKKLWERNLSSSPRTIKTSLNGSTLIDFSVGNASTLGPYLMETGDNVITTIKYVHGIDNTDDLNLRPRTVSYGADNNVWKLGDIIDSTPRIVAGIPLNKYDSIYFDNTYATFTGTSGYRNRGMVFTGGNDGMLHAFRLGKLELDWSGQSTTQKARVTNPFDGTVLGDEAWAFIPKNSLPYLKYLKDPDYCHLYYVDLSPYIFDASIAGNETDVRDSNSWRTVIIGGMRYGGACANASTCAGWPSQDCVKTPATDNGFSSYFAMDVTDPTNPSLMWEFTNPNLGFTTTGPAVMRVNAVNPSTSRRDPALNGEWYVVLGSGPTGPIDNTSNQFLGRSNQNLRFFILNLKTGALVQTIDTGIQYAFAGSMINAAADFNLDYQDDVIYAGYVKRTGSSGSYTWTDGGIGRIVTNNGTPGSTTPWVFSRVIDGIGPVTSAVSRLQSKTFSLNWLFFGTGRYFFENPPTGSETNPTIDDATGQRRLFGIKEPCFTTNNTINATCTDDVAFSSLDNVTNIASVPSESDAILAGFRGWYIEMDASGNYNHDTSTRLYRSERVITDPLTTTSGLVFFTTYKPYGDECALGGKSFLWALRYTTGGAPSAAAMKGKALVQVSTASVEQIDLSTAFREKDGRRTGAIEGVPPTSQGLSLLSQPPAVKRILHMKER